MIYSIEEMNDDHFRVFKAGVSSEIFDGIVGALTYIKEKFRPLENEFENKNVEPSGTRDCSDKTLATPDP